MYAMQFAQQQQQQAALAAQQQRQAALAQQAAAAGGGRPPMMMGPPAPMGQRPPGPPATTGLQRAGAVMAPPQPRAVPAANAMAAAQALPKQAPPPGSIRLQDVLEKKGALAAAAGLSAGASARVARRRVVQRRGCRVALRVAGRGPAAGLPAGSRRLPTRPPPLCSAAAAALSGPDAPNTLLPKLEMQRVMQVNGLAAVSHSLVAGQAVPPAVAAAPPPPRPPARPRAQRICVSTPPTRAGFPAQAGRAAVAGQGAGGPGGAPGGSWRAAGAPAQGGGRPAEYLRLPGGAQAARLAAGWCRTLRHLKPLPTSWAARARRRRAPPCSHPRRGGSPTRMPGILPTAACPPGLQLALERT
jgi:hypothetical protein